MTTSELPSVPADLRFAFVEAAWHADIVHPARDAFFARMAEAGVAGERIDVFDVTGAFEIPLHAQRLARSGRYAAVVGSALVSVIAEHQAGPGLLEAVERYVQWLRN